MPDTAGAPPAPPIMIVVNGPLNLYLCDHGPELPLLTAEPRTAAGSPAEHVEAEFSGMLFDPAAESAAARRGGPKASPRTADTRDRQVLAVLRGVGSATAADVAVRLKVKTTTADGYLWRLYQRGQVVRMNRVRGPFRYALARGADVALPAGWQRFG